MNGQSPASEVTRAPGKLVWLGEYAVLDGAPAVVAAVDRYATATRHDRGDRWQLTASNLGATCRWPATVEQNEPLALALSLLDVLADAGQLSPDAGFEIVLDSAELFIDGQKTGLGSSAAVLTALCRRVAPQLASDQAFALIDQAHRRCQRGLGSGVDVAAALQGGLHVFQRPSPLAPPVMTAVALPDALHWCAVYTGRATSTADYLARIRQWQARATWEYGAYRDAMQATAVAGVDALMRGEADEFCTAADRYGEVLEAFGQAAGVDIMSARHSELRTRAKALGVAYKSSGAGGGDMGVAFAIERPALDRFCAAAAAVEGCQVMPLALAPAASAQAPAK